MTEKFFQKHERGNETQSNYFKHSIKSFGASNKDDQSLIREKLNQSVVRISEKK